MTSICAMMLDSRFPMFLAWGDALTLIYNDGYAEILGNKHPQALGARFQDVWPEIWGEISPMVDRAMAGEATWIEDHPLRIHRHGYAEDAWFTFSYSPARDEAGAVRGLFCTVTETSQRMLAEAALSELNRTLEARIEERSGMLLKAEEQLRQAQKLEAIGQLTGGIAHDFNNLLTVIRGSVDLLRRNHLSEDRRNRYLDAIATTADRATKLTNQMLAFARRQALKPIAFDARRGLEEIVEMIRSVTGPRIVIELQMPDVPCCILADRDQFETAIINMILNGRDAMNGQGRLTIAATPKHVDPGETAGGEDFVAIKITDTGSGIPEEMLDKIFEPFFTTKSVGSGTGLGLSQAIGFARQSGGDIRVQSVEGLGTSFTLYLPQAESVPDASPATDTATSPVEGGGRRVLVVEDNESVGLFAMQALQEIGFEALLATNAEQGLAELAAAPGHFDVVFSDIVMPGMSGLQFAYEVARLYPTLPIVLASGYSEAAAQGGAQGFGLLRKPYSIEELAQALAKVLAQRPADLIVAEVIPTPPAS